MFTHRIELVNMIKTVSLFAFPFFVPTFGIDSTPFPQCFISGMHQMYNHTDTAPNDRF